MPKRRKAEGEPFEVNLHDETIGKGESHAGIGGDPEAYEVVIEGVCEIIFHRWDCAAVKLKGEAKKNSAEKQTDNLESYVYRLDDGTLGVPGDNFKAALRMAAKSKSDPRSPRKSAHDLTNATLLIEPTLASFGKSTWDYEDMRRVVIQRSAVTRIRPALKTGWRLKYKITALDPSYLDEKFIYDLVESAGKFCGLCDHRPQYGRFRIVSWKRVRA